MVTATNRFPPRPMDEVCAELLARARENRNPFLFTINHEVAPVISGLRSLDRDDWATAFGALAAPYEEKAAQAEATGDRQNAMKYYMIAYDYYHVARYPAPNSAAKLKAYRESQENFLKAARYFDPPLERVEMPFKGRPGEGAVSIGYLRKPKNIERPPVLVLWGGIDAFK